MSFKCTLFAGLFLFHLPLCRNAVDVGLSELRSQHPNLSSTVSVLKGLKQGKQRFFDVCR